MANPGVGGGDWRTELQPETRETVVNFIWEALKRHHPLSGEDGLNYLKKMAVNFEEKIKTEAKSEQDYLRKIEIKIVSMVARKNRKSHDSAFQSLQSQIQNNVQQPPIPMVFNQSQVQQHLLFQNNISSTGVPNTVGSMSQGTMPDVHVKNPNMQNMSNVNVNGVGNSMGQGTPSKNNAIIEQYANFDERKLLLIKLWSDMHYINIALAETSTERLVEFSKVINELKEVLTVEQQSSSTKISKKQRIEAFCGTALDEIDIHPPVQSKNKGGGKRKKSGQEKSVEETCGERATNENLPKEETEGNKH